MCLAIIALDVHPRYAIVLAANRDEFHARPAERAHWWNDAEGFALLGGRDLEHGGTWLGVTRHGRFAFVTNVREPGRHDRAAPSRGLLVPAVLRDRRDVRAAVEAIASDAAQSNGFNLFAGEGCVAAFASNRGPGGARVLPAGVYGVSNAQLDTPWPKLARAKSGVAAWIAQATDDPEALYGVLADRSPARDEDLPHTGLTRERERLLSAAFIASADYGTRCSSVLAISRDGVVQLAERTFNAQGETTGDVEYRFRIESAVPAIV